MDGVKRRPPWNSRRLRHVRPIAATILVAVALAATGMWWFWPVDTANAKPSIAVLPFDNLGGDEATGRLADGITEDIITDLARYREFDVIARNSTATYRGEAVDVRQVGKDLNVGYVLEGSIQRQTGQIRVTVQLVESANGGHVWSERWDRPTEDFFAVQTEVAERVANALGGYNVMLSESRVAAKRKRPADLQAYDLYALAYEAAQEGSLEGDERALAFIDAAIEHDAGFARAYVQKGWLLFRLIAYRKNWNQAFTEMERLGRRAIEIDQNDAMAHVLLATAVGSLGRNAEAAESIDRALQLNPSSADVLVRSADSMPFFGRPEEGARLCDRAFRLNPNPPAWYHSYCVGSYFFSRRFEEAIEAASRWRTLNDLQVFLLVMVAGAQAELGRDADMAKTVAVFNQRFPEVSFEWLLNNGWVFEREQEEQLALASVRKIGIRICATAEELQTGPALKRLPECVPSPGG